MARALLLPIPARCGILAALKAGRNTAARDGRIFVPNTSRLAMTLRHG